MRAAGLIPGVVYGRGREPVAVHVPERELSHIVHLHRGRAGLVGLVFEGDSGEPVPGVIKEVQRDPVSRRILAVDLQRVSLTEKIRTEVPVVAQGRAKGVEEGGVLELLIHEVEVECLPTAIPESLTVDVSQLGIGDSLPVSALSVPEGVTVHTPGTDTLVTVVPPRVEVEAAAPEVVEAVAEEAEPEVIGRGRAEEEEEEA